MQTAPLSIVGEHQSVLLPPDIHFEGDQVFVKKVGSAVMLVPKRPASDDADPWKHFREAIGHVSDDFMVERIQHPQAPRESAFE